MPSFDTQEGHTESSFQLRRWAGQYNNERAAQLSGIPGRTLYDWASTGIYPPDFNGSSPKAWSFRDLVLTRLLATLRQRGMPRPLAAKRVSQVKRLIDEGKIPRTIRADQSSVFLDDSTVDGFTGAAVLSKDLLRCFRVFSIPQPISEFRRSGGLWGPNLIKPSEYTRIHPDVMSGDPCILGTRIPTSAVFSLKVLRHLDISEIADLYPGTPRSHLEDAVSLELRLRPRSVAA